jgi:hypothetical protein
MQLELFAQRATIKPKIPRGFGLIAATVIHDTLQQRAFNLFNYHAVEIIRFVVAQMVEVNIECDLNRIAQGLLSSFCWR